MADGEGMKSECNIDQGQSSPPEGYRGTRRGGFFQTTTFVIANEVKQSPWVSLLMYEGSSFRYYANRKREITTVGHDPPS